MSSSYSTLKFELINTGEQSGTWGVTTDTNIGTAIEQAIVGMATLTGADFTANVATLTLANTNAAQKARALCLTLQTGSTTPGASIIVPAIQKPYIIINSDTNDVTVQASGGGPSVVVPAGKRTVVYNNGSEIKAQIDYLPTLALGTPLPAFSGGLGTAAPPSAGMVPVGAGGGTYLPLALTGGTGISVVYSGSALTIAATVAPANTITWTATQTFTGNASAFGAKLGSFSQPGVQVSGSAGSTVYQYIDTQQVQSYSNSASSNWTQQLTFSSTTTLDAVMAVGEMVTATQIVYSGATGYYPTAFYVDGNVTSPIWANGVSPSAATYRTAMYTYKILKTGSATFAVFATFDQY